MGLAHHETEQRILASAKRVIEERGIPFYDLIVDFNLISLPYKEFWSVPGGKDDRNGEETPSPKS